MFGERRQICVEEISIEEISAGEISVSSSSEIC